MYIQIQYSSIPLCSLYILELEDVLHLFCHCPKTQNLWESLRERLSPQFSLPELTPTLSILGNWNNKNTHNIILNHITILFKKFICDNRTHLLRIHITALMNYLKSIERLNKESLTIRISLNSFQEIESNAAFAITICSDL